MPSTVDPSTVPSGPGKLHVDVVSAAADLYASASSSLIATISSALTQPLAAPTVTAASSGGVSSTILASGIGPFYVGDSGGDSLADLFKVVDAVTDQEIFDPVSNNYVTVTSISPASVGSGFFSGNLTLNFGLLIPSGVNFKVYYGRRVTVSNLPPELATNPVIRRSAERARFPEVPRTSLAPTSVAAPLNIVSGDYPDPYMAHWKAVLRGAPAALNLALGGSSGFVNIGSKRNINVTNDAALAAGQGSAFLSVYEKNTIGVGAIGLGNPLTRINAASTGTLNPGGALPTTVELAGPDFFRTATGTAIRVGVDMVEVTFPSGLKECYVIVGLDVTNARRATVATLGGASPTFTTATVTFRWIQTNFFVGGDNDSAGIPSFHYKGMFHSPSSNLTDAPTVETAQAEPFFSSPREPDALFSWGQFAFTWGHYYQTTTLVPLSVIGSRNVTGELWGDGSVNTSARLIGMQSQRTTTINVNSTSASSWDPKAASTMIVNFSGSSAIVWTLSLAVGYAALSVNHADEIAIFVSFSGITASSAGENTQIVWPANFKFSGVDGDVRGPAGRVMLFRGTLIGGTNWYFTRADYSP